MSDGFNDQEKHTSDAKDSSDQTSSQAHPQGRQGAHGMRYPFDDIPEPAHLKEVAPGIFWVRMKLPYTLDHINLWLIENGEGYALVDTGVANDETKATWREIIAKQLGGKPINKLIVTHLHPDHVGLAGWFSRKFRVPLEMSRTDYLMCKNLAADSGREAPEEALDFYRAAGFAPEGLDRYRQRFGGFGDGISRLPDQFIRLRDGDTFQIGAHMWQAVEGSGHAPEHIALYCPELKVLISGDQVLPRISSNVSLHPTEPKGNPLQDWIDSCAAIKQRLPNDLMVLPAHNEPFYGLHERLQSLIDGHEKGLSRLLDILDEPKRAVDVFSALFKRRIGAAVYFMATGESLAHLACLCARGQIAATRDENGVDWYQKI